MTDSEQEILYWFRLFPGEWLSQERLYGMLLRRAGVGGTLWRMKAKGILKSRRGSDMEWFWLSDEVQQAEERRRIAIRRVSRLTELIANNRERVAQHERGNRLWKCIDGKWRPLGGIVQRRHMHEASLTVH